MDKPLRGRIRLIAGASILLSASICLYQVYRSSSITAPLSAPSEASLTQCRQLHHIPGPSPDFVRRTESDRYEVGTAPVLVKNATLWTGAHNGTEVLANTDVLLHGGIIRRVGHLQAAALDLAGLVVVDAAGAWVTPGIVNVHSHAGVEASPALDGAADGNSLKGIVQPWLRSLDAINTHDEAYALSVAGGVSTALVLPGSANAIGGQAFVIKLRKTGERSPSSMLLEPPYGINSSSTQSLPLRWRHMKHACGENPGRIYDGTRMDTMWAFREAYNTANDIRKRQDKYCARALSNDWKGIGEFPQELKWEALVDVLRGRVKVNTHCYEAVDLDNFIRLTQEFKFPVAAFHHASETYLVPDLLKQAYGKPPAVALFSTFARYKREAYRSSEFAPRILAENGLTVLMKTDDPTINMRYLLHEAQLAHYYGLPPNLALASVTSNAADTLGMGHRIGYIKEGHDADLVVWDSHPLALGATPTQVFIDGIAQLESPVTVSKPDAFQTPPKIPNFDKEAEDAVVYDGLPPLLPNEPKALETLIVFENVKSVHIIKNGTVVEMLPTTDQGHLSMYSTVVSVNGSIACYGAAECAGILEEENGRNVSFIDLEGGSILPGLVSYGCSLGLEHITLEDSTNSGNLFVPLVGEAPGAFGEMPVMLAVDGLQYQTRNALLAYRVGITIGVTPPMLPGFMTGLATSFSLGASHKLATGAVVQDVTAMHVTLTLGSRNSVSTQIAVLRRVLLGAVGGAVGVWFRKVADGEIPLVVAVSNADIIATLLVLKKEIEEITGISIRLTITGAGEAHLLAKELGEAGVGVILTPARPFPHTWEDRRIIPGPPLTNDTVIMKLIENNVLVGLGCEGGVLASTARNLPFDIAWASIESGGRISRKDANAMGSTNMMKLLGVDIDDAHVDLVATRGGGLFDLESSVAAILSPREHIIHIL